LRRHTVGAKHSAEQRLQPRPRSLLTAEANLAGSRPALRSLWRNRFSPWGAMPVRRLRASAPVPRSRRNRSGNRCGRSANRPCRNGKPWSPPISRKPSGRASRQEGEIVRVDATRTKDLVASVARCRAMDRDRAILPMEHPATEPAVLRRQTSPRRRIDGLPRRI